MNEEQQHENENVKEKKELPPAAEPKKEERNRYYLSVSNVFNFARYVTIFLLIGLILIMFTVFSDIFTGENFRYLLKHIDINSSSQAGKFGNIYFGDTGKTLFDEFQGDMVLVFPGGIKIYDYRGAISLSSTNDTVNPRMSVSDKYILVYDRGDSDFYIYNCLSRLCTKKSNGNIIKGYMSDSGVFAVMSSSSEYSAVISVYDQNFELISEIKRRNSVTDFAISGDGKYIVLSGTLIQNAQPLSEVCIYDLKSSDLLLNERIYGETPLRTVFIPANGENNEDDNDEQDNDAVFIPDIAVLTDKALRTFSVDGNNEYMLKTNDSSMFDISGSRLVYSVRRSGSGEWSDVYIVDIKQCQENVLEGSAERVIKIRTVGEYDYILTGSKIVRISGGSYGSAYDVNDVTDIVVFKDGVMTIGNGKSEFIRMSDTNYDSIEE